MDPGNAAATQRLTELNLTQISQRAQVGKHTGIEFGSADICAIRGKNPRALCGVLR